MTVRTTHQWVDILRGGSPQVRVTRQYIEVLMTVNVFDVQISESITVGDTAKSALMTEFITESITVGDTAGSDVFTESIIESIVVSDDATPGFWEVSVTESIVIEDSNHVVQTFEGICTDAITVNDTAASELAVDIHIITESVEPSDYADAELNAAGVVIIRTVTDAIAVSDTAAGVTTGKYGLCTEIVTPFDRAISGETKNAEVLEHFYPDDLITKCRTYTDPYTGQNTEECWVNDSSIQDSIETVVVRVVSILERIAVNDEFIPYLIVDVGDHEETCIEAITITDEATVNIHLEAISESITVTDTAVADLGRLATEHITITETLDIEIIVTHAISETINVYDTIAYELVSETTLCTYNPFIGGSANPDAPTPPLVTSPTETSQGNFQFYYPVVTPTDTLTLTGPESDDTDKLQFQRINQVSRGLTLHVYADPQWPKVKRLNIGASTCTEATAQEVLDFVELTLGKEVGFRDWRDRNWKGIINNPESPITRDRRDTYTIAIEFEAELTEL